MHATSAHSTSTTRFDCTIVSRSLASTLGVKP